MLPESVSLKVMKWKWHQWVRMNVWMASSRWRWQMKWWVVSINQQMCHGSWWQTPIFPTAKLSALASLSCSGSRIVYHWISDPTKGAEIMKKWSQIKIHPHALLQWKKRCRMCASEYFRDYRCLGMEFQWLERQRGDCLNALPVKSFRLLA